MRRAALVAVVGLAAAELAAAAAPVAVDRPDVRPPVATDVARPDPPARALPLPVAARTSPAHVGRTSPARVTRTVGAVRQPVAAAAPFRFRFAGPGFTASARVCHMPDALALDPPGDPDTTVCWVRNNFGEAPGSSSATSYVLGHSYATDPGTALGRLSRVASAQLVRAGTVYRDGVPTRPIRVLDGSVLTLWTANGRLDYRVRSAYGVPKPQFGLVHRIVDDTIPRRVVLVTCSVHAGLFTDRDLDYNVVVEAYLTGSRRS